jgi:hypothetical protein
MSTNNNNPHARPRPCTYHAKTLPQGGFLGPAIKRATVKTVEYPEVPATEGEPLVPAFSRKETEYAEYFRLRLWGRQARQLRRAGVDLIPAAV